MTVIACDPAGPAAEVEWRADQHAFHLPEVSHEPLTPAGARPPAHQLAVTHVSPEEAAEVLAAARACLVDAAEARQRARDDRAAIEDTARQVAAHRAAIEDAVAEVTAQRAAAEVAVHELAARARLARELAAGPGAARGPRPPRSRRARAAVSDIAGENLRPDPAAAQSPAEVIEALRQFRAWAGRPSFRDMAARSGQRAGASTMWKALRAKELPARLEVIDAIVEGCGGSEQDRQRFATAWRRLTMATSAGQAPGPGPPRLRAVPLPAAGNEPRRPEAAAQEA